MYRLICEREEREEPGGEAVSVGGQGVAYARVRAHAATRAKSNGTQRLRVSVRRREGEGSRRLRGGVHCASSASPRESTSRFLRAP